MASSPPPTRAVPFPLVPVGEKARFFVHLRAGAHNWSFCPSGGRHVAAVAAASPMTDEDSDMLTKIPPDYRIPATRFLGSGKGVHDIFRGSSDRLWGPEEPRVNKIVFIGKKTWMLES